MTFLTKPLLYITFVLALCVPGTAAFAAPVPQSPNALGQCMMANMTGAQQVVMMQWLFFAMAAHPDMQSYAKVSDQARKTVNQKMGQLVTTLLADKCAPQLRAAQAKSPRAIRQAFKLVGAASMRALTNNADVRSAMTDYAQYLDKVKIRAALEPGSK